MEMPTPSSDHTPLAASFANSDRGLRPIRLSRPHFSLPLQALSRFCIPTQPANPWNMLRSEIVLGKRMVPLLLTLLSLRFLPAMLLAPLQVAH
jgi:hypothetical protein